MCLDVYCGDALQGTNVQVYLSNGNNAQKWAIEKNGSNGYRLRPKCSGGGGTPMCLDIENGSIASGTNVRQWAINNSDAQSWLFIPYNPSQPIAEGRYILLYTPNASYELDVSGDTGSIENNTNIQLWNDGALSQFNSFDFIKLPNGYYKVKHAASGKCLDVTGGLPGYKTNVAVHTDNDTIAQQWAVVSNGAGYSLISRCNGYALDLPGGTTGDGKNVEVYPRLGNNNQRWSFVQAEYTVQYDANGGTGAPISQTKYYKTALTLSVGEPVRDGCLFQGWAASASAAVPEYLPGDSYAEDQDVTLYAVWKSNRYTVSYDANGGTGAPPPETFEGGTAMIAADVPSRAHHRFLGWAAGSGAAAASYAPGSIYTGGTDITLYAVWQRKLDNLMALPAALTQIQSGAFAGTAADAFVVPASVSFIGNNAFDDVAIYGYAGSYAETYARNSGLAFIPITDDWVLEENMPQGANAVSEK